MPRTPQAQHLQTVCATATASHARNADVDEILAARSQRGRASSRTAVINVKCNPKHASCQRWIDMQVARLAKVADRAEASARRDRSGA